MLNLEAVIHQLEANAEAIRALVEPISEEQALWSPDAETWSMQHVMEHVYNEERIDFRKHLKEMLSDPPQAWGEYDEAEHVAQPDCAWALTEFLAEREASIQWLRSIQAPNWDAVSQLPWGTLSAGDVLVSWAAHDYLHMRQMNELRYAWNESQAAPYSVRYAGGW